LFLNKIFRQSEISLNGELLGCFTDRRLVELLTFKGSVHGGGAAAEESKPRFTGLLPASSSTPTSLAALFS
jgi:hypothetical protein